jgi:hypothetical protein
MLNNKQADAIFCWSYYISVYARHLHVIPPPWSSFVLCYCICMIFPSHLVTSYQHINSWKASFQVDGAHISGVWISLHSATYIGMWRNSILVANLKYYKFHFFIFSFLQGWYICCVQLTSVAALVSYLSFVYYLRSGLILATLGNFILLQWACSEIESHILTDCRRYSICWLQARDWSARTWRTLACVGCSSEGENLHETPRILQQWIGKFYIDWLFRFLLSYNTS